MSIQSISNYDVPANYFFDPAKIDVQFSTATLKSPGLGEPFPTDNPSIELNQKLQMDSLIGFFETGVKPVGSDIKHILNVDSQKKWFDGLAWVDSDGTFSQANSVTEIASNVSSLDLSQGVRFNVLSLLHSDDGTMTPSLSVLNIFYDFSIIIPTLINECLITGNLKDFTNDPVGGETVRVFSERPIFHGNNLIAINVSDVIAVDGSFAISVIETETINKKVFVELNFQENGAARQKVFRNITVPNDITAALSDLVGTI